MKSSVVRKRGIFKQIVNTVKFAHKKFTQKFTMFIIKIRPLPCFWCYFYFMVIYFYLQTFIIYKTLEKLYSKYLCVIVIPNIFIKIIFIQAWCPDANHNCIWIFSYPFFFLLGKYLLSFYVIYGSHILYIFQGNMHKNKIAKYYLLRILKINLNQKIHIQQI